MKGVLFSNLTFEIIKELQKNLLDIIYCFQGDKILFMNNECNKKF